MTATARPLVRSAGARVRLCAERSDVDEHRLVALSLTAMRTWQTLRSSSSCAAWFISEVKARTQHCDFSPLVTTATDGENGGWFRNTTPGSNFWSGFHAGLMEKVRAGCAGGIRPTFISDYLERHGPHGWVTVEPGAWNTGWHDGTGFVQWTGSVAQQQALPRVGELSEAVHAARRNAIAIGARNPDLYRHLEDALAMVLRAETSCNFFWGEAWVQRCHDDLDGATRHLQQASRLYS